MGRQLLAGGATGLPLQLLLLLLLCSGLLSSAFGFIALPSASIGNGGGDALSRYGDSTTRVSAEGWMESLNNFFGGSSSSNSSNSMGGETGGEGLIDIPLNTLKKGGFKVWLFFLLLGEGKNSKAPFTVRETGDGIRILLTDEESEKTGEYLGALDVRYEDGDDAFIKVDRIDPRESTPYKGELVVLRLIVDSLEEIHLEERDQADRLFTLRSGNEIDSAKARLAARSW